jgi:hypothetical protein
MIVDRIRCDKNLEAVSKLKMDYPSLIKRTQFFKFWFASQRDADRFARNFNPRMTANQDTYDKSWCVQV